MALFQQPVIRKYIEPLDAVRIEQEWLQLQSIFHNADKQTNRKIRKWYPL